MHEGKTVFSQIMEFLPLKAFHRCVHKYRGEYKVKSFSCLDQFYCMAFAQLTFRDSLRDIEACLRSQRKLLYHMGFRSIVARNTLANANEHRDWRIYAEFAQILINQARKLYRDEKFGLELKEMVYALDSTTIDLCLSLFPWARFRKSKGAIKVHTQMDLRGNIPTFIEITEGKIHDVNILDMLIPEPGAIYLLDKGYIDFERLYRFHQAGAFFVIPAKSNLKAKRVYSHPVNKSTGLRCDQTVSLVNYYASRDYPERLRRVKIYITDQKRTLVLLTNIFNLPALTIPELYRCRWQIELFFKWIKQNLKIKSFYGTSVNAVKSQIWIAICIYVLIAIIKKRLNIAIPLYTFLQILSVNMFQRTPILQLLSNNDNLTHGLQNDNQLNLFN